MSSFESMGLSKSITTVLDDIGFVEPTPIQSLTIPKILSDQSDFIALAKTGTGKTAAFGLPAIHLTDLENSKIQTIVLCPTRELCLQITSDLKQFSQNISAIEVVPVYGGADIQVQIRALKKHCQIVVGTPGRVKDLIKQKKLHLNDVSRVVLDEADEMLNIGFKDDLDFILSHIPEQRQMLLFSATMSDEVKAVTQKYMKHPERLLANTENIGAEQVKHTYYNVRYRYKYPLLRRILDVNLDIYAIVFCRQRSETTEIANQLIEDGYEAAALNGDLSQAQRSDVMNRFRARKISILVATDIAARGLDVNDLTHVINYNLPDVPQVYTHRSGRTGRAGKKGISIAIIGPRDFAKVSEIEKKSNIVFSKGRVPTLEEISHKRIMSLIDMVRSSNKNSKESIKSLKEIDLSLLDTLTREELLNYFISEKIVKYISSDFEKIDEVSFSTNQRRDSKDRRSHQRPGSRNSNFSRNQMFDKISINLGRDNQLTPSRLIGLINESIGEGRPSIGKIYLRQTSSNFEVESRISNQLIKYMNGKSFEGKKIKVFKKN